MVTFNPPTSTGLRLRGRRVAVVFAFMMATTVPAWAGAVPPPPIVSRLPPPVGAAGFGAAVAGLDDVDADGTADVFVGAPGSARAFVVSGATGGILRQITDPTPSGFDFGFAVAAAGDIDGDGLNDLAVGAPTRPPVCPTAAPCHHAPPSRGRALVFPSASGSVARELVSASVVHPGFGRTIAGIGDVSGDGIADVAVGAPGGQGPGAVVAFSGADGAELWSQRGPSEGPGPLTAFGEPILAVPDVSGDGIGDILVSAPSGSGVTAPQGRVYVLSGATGAVVRIVSDPAASVADAFGGALSTVGDQDGDGVVDHLIGAPGTGRLHLHSGDDGVLIRTIPLPADPQGQGVSLAGAGDENGDGSDDVWVGVRSAGTAYLLDGNGAVLASTTASSTGGAFGHVVDAVGGIAPDRGTDLVVGDATEPGGGALYLVRAGPVVPQPTEQLSPVSAATARPAERMSQVAEATAQPTAQVSQVAPAQPTTTQTPTTTVAAAGPTTSTPPTTSTTPTTGASAKATLSKPAGAAAAGGTLPKTGGPGLPGLVRTAIGALLLGMAAVALSRHPGAPAQGREPPATGGRHG